LKKKHKEGKSHQKSPNLENWREPLTLNSVVCMRERERERERERNLNGESGKERRMCVLRNICPFI
jgi:hypothetical protein